MSIQIARRWWTGLLGAAAVLVVFGIGCRTAPPSHGAELTFSADRFTGTNGVTLPYRLLPPAAQRPGALYPLVLMLHGSGQIGEDNSAQLGPFTRTWASPEIRRRFPAYVLVPQFPTRSAMYSPDPGDGLPASNPEPCLVAAMELVDSVVQKLPVDPRRVYVVGFSMGGSSAWNALLLRPDRFAAAIPISGVPPSRALAPRLASANLLVVHGTADTENAPDAARAMVAALQSAGATRVRLREYEGVGHEIPPDLFEKTEWREWLFAQRRPGKVDPP